MSLHLKLGVILLMVQRSHNLDVGFDLLFTSSRTKLQDYPIYFEKPIPTWATGNYIRNGLGRFEMGERNFTHAFDAYAKLASWKLNGSQEVLFTTKFLRTRSYKDSKRKNTIEPYLLFDSTQPPFSFVERMKSLFRGIDNTNVNVYRFGQNGTTGRCLALSDFWQNYEFDPKTLRTKGRINPKLPAGHFYNKPFPLPSSGHPVREHGTSNHINFLSILNPGGIIESSINVVRIKSAKRRKLIASIPTKKVPYMHSFGLSPNYAIIFANPLYVDVLRMVKTGAAVQSLDWKPEDPTMIYVVHLKTGSYTPYESAAVFNMHHINSYEQGNKLYVDFVTYPNVDFMKSLELDRLRDKSKRDNITADCFLRRYTFDLVDKTVSYFDFQKTGSTSFVNNLDLPVINQNFLHKPYCVVYGLVTKADSIHLAAVSLVRKNLCRPDDDQYWYSDNHYPSEPWFLPHPRGGAEDDGVLLSVVLDGVRAVSYLGMFDPMTMKKINQAYMPIAIPFSLHGRILDP